MALFKNLGIFGVNWLKLTMMSLADTTLVLITCVNTSILSFNHIR